MTSRRNALTFTARDPDGGTYEVYIRESRLLALAKVGRWILLEARDLVPMTLRTPTVIFEGIRWEKDEDKDRPGWRCYCAKPAFMYDRSGERSISDPHRVFLVFVDADGVAYNWRWERADELDPETPQGNERFADKVYDQRDAANAREK